MTNKIRLTGLPAHLRQEGYDPPTYRWLREAAIDGVFPACQINTIWHFSTADTLAIVEALSLQPATTVSQRAA